LADSEREKEALKTELDRFRENFQAEQTSWLDEKEKVIRYVVHTCTGSKRTSRAVRTRWMDKKE
jgi:hypothetical protein